MHQPQNHHQQHPNHHGMHQNSHVQAVAQQQHYNRLGANNGGSNGHSMPMDHTSGSANADGNWPEENRRVLGWIAELLTGPSRETALMELSKKREQVPELALIIWHSFGRRSQSPAQDHITDSDHKGVMTALLQEIISVYPLLNPSQLTAAASNRVCNALALLQCVASHSETRGLFLNGQSAL